MGLDMYLYAEKHVSNSSDDFIKKFPEYAKERAQYEAVMSGSGMYSLPTPEYGGATITKCVGYWRKANAIHGWITRNLANGLDECQRINLDRTDLILLRDSCVKELDNRASALPNKEGARTIKLDEANNPEGAIRSLIEDMNSEFGKRHTAIDLADPLSVEPVEGFFFGGTEKDEYYYSALEYTVDTINSLLAGTVDESYSFYYQASW
jgi:hypothetical protein